MRERPELDRMLDQVRDKGVLIVTRLDRLARSTKDLLESAEKLNETEAELRSSPEPWADTTSPAGRMVLTVFAGIAEDVRRAREFEHPVQSIDGDRISAARR